MACKRDIVAAFAWLCTVGSACTVEGSLGTAVAVDTDGTDGTTAAASTGGATGDPTGAATSAGEGGGTSGAGSGAGSTTVVHVDDETTSATDHPSTCEVVDTDAACAMCRKM